VTVGKFPGFTQLKGIVPPNITILPSFIHPPRIPTMVVNTHCKKYNGSQWLPSTFWLFFQISSSV